MDSRNPRPRALRAALLLGLALSGALSCGCLVLALHPAYDDQSIAWDDALLGEWRAPEDNVEVRVERGEWRSYRIHYKHPVEEADFTAHLTAIGDSHFLDLMPLRGHEYGAALVPAHIIVRIRRQGERWQVSALDYDRAREGLKTSRRHGPAAAFDQRHNVVLTGDTTALRDWLRTAGEEDFSEPVFFERAVK